jgi:eukaryotic-like serine/threonine-protein kinase
VTTNRSKQLVAVPISGAPVATELVPGTRVEAYEIEGKIGEGAMGAVYRAVHPTIGKHVAVKIMNSRLSADPGAIERFTREARSVAAIRHPGIVDVFGFGTLDDGRAYLIMEWLDGSSLGTRLEGGSLAFDAALDIVDQIARALSAAHDKGITHRDLKPDNVFLEQVAREKPIVKILDFGLAKLGHEEGRAAMTESGHSLARPSTCRPSSARARA